MTIACDDATDLESGDFLLFTDAQAKAIIEFLKGLAYVNEPEMLVVHCTAGVSRSGAVATFVRDIFRLDFEEFVRDNPQISPNRYIYRTLQKVWVQKL